MEGSVNSSVVAAQSSSSTALRTNWADVVISLGVLTSATVALAIGHLSDTAYLAILGMNAMSTEGIGAWAKRRLGGS